MSATQQNADQNQNQGGNVGEIEASLADLFSNLGASTSTATASGQGFFDSGAKTVISGGTKSASETISTAKIIAIVGICFVGYILLKRSKK